MTEKPPNRPEDSVAAHLRWLWEMERRALEKGMWDEAGWIAQEIAAVERGEVTSAKRPSDLDTSAQ